MTVATQQRNTPLVLDDPVTGQVVEVPVGSCLRLRLRRSLGVSRWQVAERPSYLVPIEGGGHDLVFLVFGPPEGDGSGAAATLRLVRHLSGRPDAPDVRVLTVVVG